ncbi:MAG: DUF3596 domain-containing protein [Proteobacteria bacterium]|nr:DUF3596 domain-containing protein [Pseudomonadota bacterium]
MTNYVTIKKFCADTGYSPDAVRSKISHGDWEIGKEYIKAPDGRILINIEGFEKWAESTPGVRESSESSIEIDIRYNGKCCRERLALKPTPSNLKKAAQHRAAIFNASMPEHLTMRTHSRNQKTRTNSRHRNTP